jgi:type I restriction enzyme, S subunit
MAVWSGIPNSALEYGRLDAEFYHPMYLDELRTWREIEKRIGTLKLGRAISVPVRTGRTPKLREMRSGEASVHFIKTDTVREGWIDFDNSVKLPMRVVGARDVIPHDALVVTIIGATPDIVGRAAIVRSSDPKCVTNQNIAVISVGPSIDAYFLTAYLQTKFGRDQIWRHARRTEQVNLNCREVERILVPNPPLQRQREIGALVRESLASVDQSINLYQSASKLIDKEMSLDDLHVEQSVGNVASFSGTFAGRRIDADYFQPQYAAMRKLISGYSGGHEALLACCDSMRPNIDPSKKPNDVFRYIELSDINSSIGIVEPVEPCLGRELPTRARRKVQPGDVIASAVVGSLDRAALIGDDQNGFLASTGFFHLRPTKVSPEYLTLLVRSKAVRMQLQQEATGGILSAVADSRLKHVIVPRLSHSLQEQAGGLLQESHAAKTRAAALLIQAKEAVEALLT